MNPDLTNSKYYKKLTKKYYNQYKLQQNAAVIEASSETPDFSKKLEQCINSLKVGLHSISVAFEDLPKIYRNLNSAHLSSGNSQPSADKGLPDYYQVGNNQLKINVSVGKANAWEKFTILRGYLYSKDCDPVALNGEIIQLDATKYQLVFNDFDYEINATDELTLGYGDKNKICEILTVSIQK